MHAYCLIFPVSKYVAEYFDLVDSTSKQVDRLLHQSFITAKEMLESARHAPIKQQESLVMGARQKFYEAIAVEKNENLMLALVGLSMCHMLLGDHANAEKYLEKIGKVKLTRSEYTKSAVKDYLSTAIGPWGMYKQTKALLTKKPGILIENINERKASFSRQKEECIRIGERLLHRISQEVIEPK